MLKTFFKLNLFRLKGFPENFVKMWLDLAEILRIRKLDWKCLFVCLFVCLFIYLFVFCFNHCCTPQESSPENFLNIRLDLAEILRIKKLDWKMFICLFVCLFVYKFVCFFILIILGHPHKVTLKILWGSDLICLRYLGYKKCVFVCFLTCFFLF